jgi:glycosyltransferase involved in cell wall biosynthesis
LKTVSIVVPTYNRPDLVRRAVRSVLEQTYSEIECIVVDDGPSEETRAAVESFDDDRVHYLRHSTNRGASSARNTGIEFARGDYVAFLDDDDEWHPEKLEKQVPLLESSPPEVGFVYCWMRYFNGDEVVNTVDPTLSGNVFSDVLDVQRLAGCPTLLVRAEVIEEIGRFNQDLPRGNDGEFIRRLARAYETDYVPEVLVHVHVDHDYTRISREDEVGIRNALHAQRHFLVEFDDGFREHPTRRANMYGKMGNRHADLGELRASFACHLRSLRAAPTSPVVYRRLFNSAKTFVSTSPSSDGPATN